MNSRILLIACAIALGATLLTVAQHSLMLGTALCYSGNGGDYIVDSTPLADTIPLAVDFCVTDMSAISNANFGPFVGIIGLLVLAFFSNRAPRNRFGSATSTTQQTIDRLLSQGLITAEEHQQICNRLAQHL